MNKPDSIGEVAKTLHDLTKMNQVYVMNVLLDVEGRIKTRDIYGGICNLSISKFDVAGDYILDAYIKHNPKEEPYFTFEPNAMKEIYYRVDSKGTKNE